jgi:hypothetical protein
VSPSTWGWGDASLLASRNTIGKSSTSVAVGGAFHPRITIVGGLGEIMLTCLQVEGSKTLDLGNQNSSLTPSEVAIFQSVMTTRPGESLLFLLA